VDEGEDKEWIIPFFEAQDFSSEVKTIVNLGGNIDTLMVVILKANPKMQAILVDRGDVVIGANQVLEVARVVDRCQIVGEKFFDSIRQDRDLYLLSRVLLNTE
jgi:hypothetical protein